VYKFFQSQIEHPNAVRANQQNFTRRSFRTKVLNGSWIPTSHFPRNEAHSCTSVGICVPCSPNIMASRNVKKNLCFVICLKKANEWATTNSF